LRQYLFRKPLSRQAANDPLSSLSIPDLYDATIAELREGLNGGLFTTVQLVLVRLLKVDSSEQIDVDLRRHISAA
jgi:hypothetical protein